MEPPPHPSRDGIRSSPGYIGTLNDFLLQTSWLRRFRVDYLMNAQCSRIITCSVIGVMNSDGLCIEPHGDFTLSGDSTRHGDLILANMRFSLRSPQPPHDNFKEEFNIGVSNLQTLVDIYSKYSPVSEIISHLRMEGNQEICEPILNFKHPAFGLTYGRPKLDDLYHPSMDIRYLPYLKPFEGTFRAVALPVYLGRTCKDIRDVKEKLADELVSVTFQLFHKDAIGVYAKPISIRLLELE